MSLPFPPAADAAPMRSAAGGAPLTERTAREAADWLTLLMSGEAGADDRERWQRWRAARPDNERAWLHIEAVSARWFQGLDPVAAYQTLSPLGERAVRSRRKAIKALCGVGTVGAVGLLASRSPEWRQLQADHHSGTGEQRRIMLSDGTRVALNTASAIDLRFDGTQRRVRLVAGEMMVETGHAVADLRPFVVESAEGRMRALGTRFNVRQFDGRTLLTVFEGAVELRTFDAFDAPRVLQAGEQLSFERGTPGFAQPLQAHADAWMRGQLIADDMRLADFMAELGRYRPGLVRCEPAVADLRLSGVFPVRDTDRILAMLPHVLPVEVRLRTRYWVTVEAAR